MSNQSIKQAFERFWQHVAAAIFNIQTQVDNKSAVQIITWEADD